MQIKTFQPQDHKIKALIYGSSGAGKTFFGGTAEKSIIASAEGGLLSIADKSPNFAEIKSLKDLKDLYSFLLKEKHEFETVIIDSITEINEIIKSEIEIRTGHSMQLQDWGTLHKEIRDLFKKFRDLPLHVILIAQEQYIQDEDKIKKIAPSLNGKAATDVSYFMDIVGYIHIENDGKRWIETTTNKKLFTKDRSNRIGNDCPPDFSEWKKRVKTIKTGKQKTTVDYSEPETETENKKPDTRQTNHLHNLKEELFKRGATDEKSAIELLNKSIQTKFDDFNISEMIASKALIKLLQVKHEKKSEDKPKKDLQSDEKTNKNEVTDEDIKNMSNATPEDIKKHKEEQEKIVNNIMYSIVHAKKEQDLKNIMKEQKNNIITFSAKNQKKLKDEILKKETELKEKQKKSDMDEFYGE